MTKGRLDSRYSDPAAQAPSWASTEALLREAELYWLTTVRSDGRPHTTPLVGVWHDGTFCFTTGPGEQKHVNLDAGSAATVVTGTNTWAAGTDVVLEGSPARLVGRGSLAPYAAAFREKYGDAWDWHPTEEGFTTEGGGEPWVYVLRPAKVLVFGKDPHSQSAFGPDQPPAAS